MEDIKKEMIKLEEYRRERTLVEDRNIENYMNEMNIIIEERGKEWDRKIRWMISYLYDKNMVSLKMIEMMKEKKSWKEMIEEIKRMIKGDESGDEYSRNKMREWVMTI